MCVLAFALLLAFLERVDLHHVFHHLQERYCLRVPYSSSLCT